MKILFLTHTFPYPPDDGMRSTCYQLIRHISKNNECSLLSLTESDEEKKHIPEIQKWCRDVQVVRHETLRSPVRRIANVLFEKTPFCVVQFHSQEFASKLRAILKEGNYDIVHFLSINVSGYHDCLGGTPGLLFPHDSVSMQFYRNAERETNPLRKLYMVSQWRKMKDYEMTMVPLFSKTVVVSEVDRKWINAFCPDVSIPIIPGGVDAEYFKPQDVPEESPSVVFRGVMNFIPNTDAALYFHSDIMPLVRKEFPDLRYTIVGKYPTSSILKIHDGKSTIVTGLVKDIRDPMARATVNICPMRGGSGMKNKILEAWAMERAVVATPLACDGIDCEHGKNVMVAGTPETFAKNVIDLFNDPELRKTLGKNGRQVAVAKYSWTAVAGMFQDVYKSMIQSGDQASPKLVNSDKFR